MYIMKSLTVEIQTILFPEVPITYKIPLKNPILIQVRPAKIFRCINILL